MMRAMWATASVVGVVLASSAQTLTWIGTMGGAESKALALSADGRVLVGYIANNAGIRRALVWREGQGFQILPDLWDGSIARGVSADGGVIVGATTDENGFKRAFRLGANGLAELGTLGGGSSIATAVSFSGAVIVGGAQNGSGFWRAFRWTQATGMQELGTFGGAESYAYAVSANGSVVVGKAHSEIGEWRAFRWQIAGRMEDLGTLGGTWAEAYGVSADGEVVVGWAEHPDGFMGAFRWTATEGMRDLGTLGGAQSKALAVSSDGSIVVGWSDTPTGKRRAFRWTPHRGMEDLNVVYASLLADGSELLEARAITPDGRYIAGWGYNAATGLLEAFLLETEGTNHTTDPMPRSLQVRVKGSGGEISIVSPLSPPLRVEVLDLCGRLVAHYGPQSAGDMTFYIPSLPTGLYFVRIFLGTQVVVEPVVVVN